MEKIIGKHYFFPYIIGEVLEETSFTVIPDVEVHLMYNDYPVPMIDPGWANPYYTSKATKGYYLFWPDFIKGDMNTEGDNIFKIIFRNKKFFKKEISFSVKALEKFNYNKSQVLPLALLTHQDGEEI